MANPNNPQGLRPIGRDGAYYVGVTRTCCVPASVAANIFLGDPVVALGGGDAYGVPNVGLATAGAGQPIYGSMISVVNGPAGGGGNAIAGITQNSTIYRQANTLTYIQVAMDPAQLFVIQEDSVGGAISASVAEGAVGNLSTAVAGSIYTAFSGTQLQSSSVTAAANPTYQLKIIELLRGPGNSVGNYADWVVHLNNSQYASNSGV